MSRTLATTLLVLLAAAAGAGESPVIDLRAFLEVAPDASPIVPGIEHLVSGGRPFVWEAARRSTAPPDAILALGAAGHEDLGAIEILPGRILVADASADLRRDVEGLADDAGRSVRIDFELVRADGRVTAGRIRTIPGRWEAWWQGRLHRLLTDYDVEIACGDHEGSPPSAVGDPIPGTVRDGTVLRVRPALVEGGRRVVLEATLSDGSIRRVEKIHTRARYLGILDRPIYDGMTVAVSGATMDGSRLVFRFLGPEGESKLTLVPRVVGAGGRGRVRLLDASLLVRPGLDALFPEIDLRDDEDFDEPGLGGRDGWRMERYLLLRRDRRDELLPGVAFDALEVPRSAQVAAAFPGRILVAGDAAEDAARDLAERTAALARTVRTEITVRAGKTVVAGADLRSLAGRPAVMRLGTDETVLADYDVEVGCYNQIADPLVDTLFTGWIARARPRIAPDGKAVRLEILLVHQTREANLETREVGDTVNGILHHPTIHAREHRLDLVLSDGEQARVPLGRGPDGQEHVAEIRATLE